MTGVSSTTHAYVYIMRIPLYNFLEITTDSQQSIKPAWTKKKVYRTNKKVYRTNKRVYRTKKKVYRTKKKVYRTKKKVFRTNKKVYRTKKRGHMSLNTPATP